MKNPRRRGFRGAHSSVEKSGVNRAFEKSHHKKTIRKRMVFSFETVSQKQLLEFDFGAGGLEALGELLGVGLGDVFLDHGTGLVGEVLGFLETEAGGLAEHLDDVQ